MLTSNSRCSFDSNSPSPSFEDPVRRALPNHSLGPPGAPIGPVPATVKVAKSQTIWSRAKILTPSNHTYLYSNPPPTTSHLLFTLEDFGLKSRIYRAPYYSNEKDAPPRPREYAGLVYNLKGGEGIALLDDWVSEFGSQEPSNDTFHTFLQDDLSVGGWEYAGVPPSVREVRTWLRSFEGQLIQQLPKLPSRTQASSSTDTSGTS